MQTPKDLVQIVSVAMRADRYCKELQTFRAIGGSPLASVRAGKTSVTGAHLRRQVQRFFKRSSCSQINPSALSDELTK